MPPGRVFVLGKGEQTQLSHQKLEGRSDSKYCVEFVFLAVHTLKTRQEARDGQRGSVGCLQ
jgi:hypothetical protein